MPTVDKEEEILILYAMHACGGKGSARGIINYIVVHDLAKPRPGDDVARGGETKLENDLRWARQNLKDSGELVMPERGVWAISARGRARLFRVVRVAHERIDEIDESMMSRYSDKFLQKLAALGSALPKADEDS